MRVGLSEAASPISAAEADVLGGLVGTSESRAVPMIGDALIRFGIPALQNAKVGHPAIELGFLWEE